MLIKNCQYRTVTAGFVSSRAGFSSILGCVCHRRSRIANTTTLNPPPVSMSVIVILFVTLMCPVAWTSPLVPPFKTRYSSMRTSPLTRTISSIGVHFVINVRNNGGEVFREMITSYPHQHYISIDFEETDGSHIKQLVDFDNVSCIEQNNNTSLKRCITFMLFWRIIKFFNTLLLAFPFRKCNWDIKRIVCVCVCVCMYVTH